MKNEKKFRLIILRHSERVDTVFRNCNWTSEAFVDGEYIPNHPQLPLQLPIRSDPQSYLLDTPLTRFGSAHAYYTGKYFRDFDWKIDRVYTSPAMRCVQTADAVLDGLGQRDEIPLRIDLALHEATRKDLPIENDQFFASAGFLVDENYQANLPSENRMEIIAESRLHYYRRMDAILKRILTDMFNEEKDSNYLIVTHRSCVTLLAAMLNLERFDAEHLKALYDLETKKRSEVNFLSMIIAEYDGEQAQWRFLSEIPRNE